MGDQHTMQQILLRAGAAKATLSHSSGGQRDSALQAIAAAITAMGADILAANARDQARAASLAPALRDRLLLNAERLQNMARAVAAVAAQPDPLQGRTAHGTGPSGVQVFRQRVPLGVIAMIYEARPNVTAEAAALAVKAGNAVILRGGSEALASNQAIWQAVRQGLRAAQLPEDSVLLVEDTRKEAVAYLLAATGFVDLVIPRGGAGLMAMVDAHARVPVIRHGQGICHVYIDADADLDVAVAIALNAKLHRPGVCNAMETLLIHAARSDDVLAILGPRLRQAGVELRADAASRQSLALAGVEAMAATEEDYATEFLDLVLAVRTVSSCADAVAHIARYGTHHTAAIVTENAACAERFLGDVDASCVLWNASTRLNDGGELGLGAEMGVSTSKMHAYGPMGAAALTAEKFVVIGSGQIRT